MTTPLVEPVGEPPAPSSCMAAALEAGALRRTLDPACLPFESTADVVALDRMSSQPRAAEALDLALEIGTPGYNLFATGAAGTGKRSVLERELRRRAADRPAPHDWVYLFNFAAPTRPAAVALPTARGPELARDVAALVEEARRGIRAAFESDSYRERHRAVHEPLEARRQQELERLRAAGRERDVALELTPAGMMSMPLQAGHPMDVAAFEQLPEARQAEYHSAVAELENVVGDAFAHLQQIEHEEREAHRKLDREVALFALGQLFEEAKRRWSDVERLATWLNEVREDLIEHLDALRSERAQRDETGPSGAAAGSVRGPAPVLSRYEVNVLVTHESGEGAPVIVAHDCGFYELFGRIEYETAFGAAVTDHRHLRAGAVHCAAGGYLLLRADEVLAHPFVWGRLKELLRTGRARIENLGAQYMLFPSASLDPEPIEADLTVVLVGSPELYRLLYALDDDVRRLFKVRADFDAQTNWDDAAVRDYAAFISGQVRDHGLRHFDRTAVARMVEHGARLAGHRERLTTRFVDVADVVAEASHWAGRAGAAEVSAAHVERALRERRRRSDLPEQHLREETLEGTLRVEVDGVATGQVNGLAVVELGDHRFGHPVRVSATVGPGRGEVIDIDREAELSGPIHDKGFLILSALLRHRYCRETPLALHASLVFEQSYGAVEGDSASGAELLALLSALAAVPVSQAIAVTGSVDQHGRIQAVGGINEKIEGFFELCNARGLTGDQGVVIPAANLPHLMLDTAVVDAVGDGAFHLWAITTVDEGIELLTGESPGVAGLDGVFAEDSFHGRVQERIAAFARLARNFQGPAATPLA